MPRITVPPRGLAFVVVAVTAAALGWTARGQHRATTPVVSVALSKASPAPVRPSDDEPLIAVASDGHVTLRVEQQPLQWVLEQIAAQAQWPELAAAVGIDVGASRDTRAGRDAAAACGPAPVAGDLATVPAALASPTARPPAPLPIDASQVQRLLDSAVDTERLDGLSQARLGGVRLDERTLRLLFEGDPSEHVRMVAFETYLSTHADSPDALRAALQDALHLASPRIRHEAQLRLDALHALERSALLPSDDP